jgi:hypothetical protein
MNVRLIVLGPPRVKSNQTLLRWQQHFRSNPEFAQEVAANQGKLRIRTQVDRPPGHVSGAKESAYTFRLASALATAPRMSATENGLQSTSSTMALRLDARSR